MNLTQLPPIVLALLIIYLLVKDALIPLIKKKNNKNPISIERFYQEFVDFKKEVNKRCGERKNDIKEIDEKLDEIRIKHGGD